MENQIQIYDNVISLEENNIIYNQLLYKGNYHYGEVDDDDHPPTGMVCSLDNDTTNKFVSIAKEKNSFTKELSVNRVYANLFSPKENPYFHQDESVITALFYVNPPTSYDEGGETQFIVDDNVFGLLPKPCRLVLFDGKIPHRATSFRTIPRITVAIKFNCPEENIANGPSGNVLLNK